MVKESQYPVKLCKKHFMDRVSYYLDKNLKRFIRVKIFTKEDSVMLDTCMLKDCEENQRVWVAFGK